MAKKAALGKGMASLIKSTDDDLLSKAINRPPHFSQEKEREVSGKEEIEKSTSPYLVSTKDIMTNPHQPRKIFKDKDLAELAESIKENGIIQPLIVSRKEDGFELIAGERRLRAAKLANLEMVPVVFKKGSERDKMVMSIIENIQRSDLNCIEVALAYFQLMDEYKLTQEEVAKKLGKERSSVANFLRLLKLPRVVVDFLQKEQLSLGHGKLLASVKEREDVIRFAESAVAENLSVKELEKLIKTKKKTTTKDFSLKEEKLDQWDSLREKLEQRTGFHIQINAKKNGSGLLSLKFNNEAEFNDLYEYLLKR